MSSKLESLPADDSPDNQETQVQFDPQTMVTTFSKNEIPSNGTNDAQINQAPENPETLEEMDKTYGWLSEVEEQCKNPENSFVSKTQYVALSNHFQRFLENLQQQKDHKYVSEINNHFQKFLESLQQGKVKKGVLGKLTDHFQKFLEDIQHQQQDEDTRELVETLGEFTNLFNKFRVCYIGGEKVKKKLFEIQAKKSLADLDIDKLRVKISSLGDQIQAQEDLVNALRTEDIAQEKERTALVQKINVLQDKLAAEKEQKSKKQETPPADDGSSRIEDTQKTFHELQSAKSNLENELNLSKERENALLQTMKNKEKTIETLQRDLTMAKLDLQNQLHLAEKYDARIAELNLEIAMKKQNIKELKMKAEEVESGLLTSQNYSKRLLKDVKKLEVERDAAVCDSVKFKTDVTVRDDRLNRLEKQIDTMTLDAQDKKNDIYSLRTQILGVKKQKRQLSLQVKLLEDKRINWEKRVKSLKESNKSCERSIASLEKEVKECDKTIKELVKQKDTVTEQNKKLEEKEENLKAELTDVQEENSNCKKDLEDVKKIRAKLQETIKQHEIEIKRLTIELLKLNKDNGECKNEIKSLKLELTVSEGKINSLEKELEEQHAKNKTLLGEEQFYHKLSVDAKQEVELLNEKFSILNQNIVQLKDCNKELDDKCKKMVIQAKSDRYELRLAKEACSQATEKRAAQTREINHLRDEIQSLHKRIAEYEQELHTLRLNLKTAIREKELVQTKLSEVHHEIQKDKDKVKHFEYEVTLSNKAVEQKEKEVHDLQMQLSKIKRSKSLLMDRLSTLHSKEDELQIVQKELDECKAMNKGMEDEMQQPINYHRLRVLEGTDPERAQLVTKNQSLQKQLIQKTTELQSKDIALQQTQEQIRNLEERMEKHNESNIETDLMTCRKELKSRTEQLRSLKGENLMYENLVAKYRNQTIELRNELKKLKLAEFHARHPIKKRKSNIGESVQYWRINSEQIKHI